MIKLIKKVARLLGIFGPLIEIKSRFKQFSINNFIRDLEYKIKGAPDGLPIPPAHLRYLVIGTTSISTFLDSGKIHADELIQETLKKNNFSIVGFQNVLDFGCGCGRIIRYWKYLENTNLYGVDFNPKLIDWCTKNLPFAQYKINKLYPKVNYETEYFDFIYARSVFTHLPLELQIEWLNEFSRLLKHDGILLFTTRGATSLSLLDQDEKAKYKQNQLIVRDVDYAGQNLCTVFHPPKYVKHLLNENKFTLIDFVPGKDVGHMHQDIYLAIKA